MLSTTRRNIQRSRRRSLSRDVGEGLMEKVSSLPELEDRIKEGFKAEVLYNYRTGNYEVPTWWEDTDGSCDNHKTFKFPKSSANKDELIKLVYGK